MWLKAVVIIVDSLSEDNELLPKSYSGFRKIIDQRGDKTPIINNLGIMQFPSNFLINQEGVIVAKNIWGIELKKAIDMMN
jgi:hypothetical protein